MAFHPLATHVLVSGDKSGAIHTLNTDAQLGQSIDRNVMTRPPLSSSFLLPLPSSSPQVLPRSHTGGPINALVFDKSASGGGGAVMYTAGGDGRV
jgi:hypothetical protein